MRLIAIQLEPDDSHSDPNEEGTKKNRLSVGNIEVFPACDDEDLGREAVGVEDLFGAKEEVGGTAREC